MTLFFTQMRISSSNPKSAMRKIGMTASCLEREEKVVAERELVKEIEMRERKKEEERH